MKKEIQKRWVYKSEVVYVPLTQKRKGKKEGN